MDHVYPSQLRLGRNQSPRAKEVLGGEISGYLVSRILPF